MPGEDASKLVFSIIGGLEDWKLVGYFMFFISTGGWFFHTRWQRRVFTSEIERISDERNKVQVQKLGKKIKSSKEAL
jgi:hypothetical protein